MAPPVKLTAAEQPVATWAEGVVEGEGQPREGHVVAHQGVREHPPDLTRCEPPVFEVRHKVDIVIPVELALERRPEGRTGHQDDTDREQGSGESPHRAPIVARPIFRAEAFSARLD